MHSVHRCLSLLLSFVHFGIPVIAQYASNGNGNGYYQQVNAAPNGGASVPYGGYGPGAVPSTPDIIDNEVVEAPMIRCTDRGVEFGISTRNPFRGNIYVQGQFGLPECRREFYNNDSPQASIEVRLNDCGMIRERRPHGMAYSLVIITNFHPRFVTKVDRAYKILCSYQHAERPVGVDLEVGSVPTQPVASDAILVPDCEYSMRMGDVNGPPAPSTVKVGDLIYHRWECQNSPVYGMLVKNCRVFDGGNENVTLIDEHGCPTTTGVIQSPPVYSEGLNMAYAPIFAFHFPDRTQMNFRCQIQSCNKMDNECIGLTPPNCPQNYGPTAVYPGPSNGYGPASAQPYASPQQEPSPYPLSPSSPPPTSGIYPIGGGNGNGGPSLSAINVNGIGQRPPLIGAGFSPSWPPNALLLGSVLQGNPSQVFQGISRPWPRRRMERKEGHTMEQQILLTTQQLRRHENGSWPPSVLILNRNQSAEARKDKAGATARRFFTPLAPETEQDEEVRRQRRAEAKTQDVMASSTVVNDGLQGLEWSFENGREKVRQRSVVEGSGSQLITRLQNSYCLDRSILLVIVVVFGLLSALVFTMLCYLLWDFLLTRHRCGKGLISWGKSKGRNGSRSLLANLPLRKNPLKRAAYQHHYSSHTNPTAMAGPKNEQISASTPPTTATLPNPPAGRPRQRGSPREVLAGIMNAGLFNGTQQRVPPPVPPKQSTMVMAHFGNK